MSWLRWCFCALFCCALAVCPLVPARAEGTLIPATGVSDFVHDPARGLIYISSGLANSALPFERSDFFGAF